MGLLKDAMTAFIKPAEIAELVAKIAKSIQKDFEGESLVVICPLKGSVPFLADFARKLELPVQFDFVHVSPIEKGGAVRIHKDISVNITGRNVIILEEIVDSGRTLSFLKTRLQASHPKTLRLATLLDKPARREIPLKPDYIGMTIDDRYVVGYGMDSEELGRNYDGIYYFNQ
jgi:hypoxanthine phosphoribosyltransferase